MYKRYLLYGIIIFGFYKLFQHPLARSIYDQYETPISSLTFVLIIFIGAYSFFHLRYKKNIVEPISKTPVEFDVEKGYSVIEMGWLYHANTQDIITAGVIELWKFNYIRIEEINSEIYITLLKFPSKLEYKLLLRLIFETEDFNIHMIQDPRRGLSAYNIESLNLFNKQKTLFLKNNDLRKGHEESKSKLRNFIWIGILGFLFIRIMFSIHILLTPFALIISFLGLKQIYKILYYGVLTEKGARVYDRLISYREYLTVLGGERFSHQDLIETDPHTYDDLPYLILFKIEKRWTKRLSYLWGKNTPKLSTKTIFGNFK